MQSTVFELVSHSIDKQEPNSDDQKNWLVDKPRELAEIEASISWPRDSEWM
ncbi:hypothetical protein [Vibrio fluminensis]|uniref:hypothetical protein n=1 Tax=Vibrio fluminensis TaxID=2783614 RepID=UPI001887C9DE|nr:hypothetical protein [Vibrio fluminensis]